MKCEFCKVNLEGKEIVFDGKHFCSENCSLYYENGYLIELNSQMESEIRHLNQQLKGENYATK